MGKAKTKPAPAAVQEPPAPPVEAQIAERFRNRVLPPEKGGYRLVPSSQIKVHPKNWRMHPEFQSDALKAILERIGNVGSLITRELGPDSYQLLDGHLRLDLAGDSLVGILVTDLTAEEADEILATFDHITSLAQTDTTKLGDLLKSLKDVNVPLANMGWPEFKMTQALDPSWMPTNAAAESAGAGTGRGSADPGEEFPAHDETIETQHKCPKCSYTWSGKSN